MSQIETEIQGEDEFFMETAVQKTDRREYFREYYRQNKEKRKEIDRRWREQNKEKYNEIRRNYYAKKKSEQEATTKGGGKRDE